MSQSQVGRYSLSEWPNLPEVKRYHEIRESLKYPNTPKTQEELEERKRLMEEAKQTAMKASEEFRTIVNRKMEEVRMRANLKGIGSRMNVYGAPGMMPQVYSSSRLMSMNRPPPDMIVLGCEKCGNDQVNWRSISRKARRKASKNYPWLSKGDLKKGIPYCIKCDKTMKKLSMSELQRIREEKSEGKLRYRKNISNK